MFLIFTFIFPYADVQRLKARNNIPNSYTKKKWNETSNNTTSPTNVEAKKEKQQQEEEGGEDSETSDIVPPLSASTPPDFGLPITTTTTVKGILNTPRNQRNSLKFGVSFRSDNLSTYNNNSEDKKNFDDFPIEAKLVGLLEKHSKCIESAKFLSDGSIVTAGSPGDSTFRLYAKGIGTIGIERYVYDISNDLIRSFHGDSYLIETNKSFEYCEVFGQVMETKKSSQKNNLLLIGAQKTKCILAYRLFHSTHTPPECVFCFPTHHQSHIQTVCGAYFSNSIGIVIASAARGTTDIKFWNSQGVLLLTYESECLINNLRFSSPGGEILVVSSSTSTMNGLEFGEFLSIRFESGSNGGKLKVNKISQLTIDSRTSKVLKLFSNVPQLSTPKLSGTNKKLIIGDTNLFKLSQEVNVVSDNLENFQSEAIIAPSNGSYVLMKWNVTNWEVLSELIVNISNSSSLPTMTTKKGADLNSSPTLTDKLDRNLISRVCMVIPEEHCIGGKKSKVLIARGKDVYFYDSKAKLLCTIQGKVEDGDVIGLSCDIKFENVIIVSFGSTCARLWTIP